MKKETPKPSPVLQGAFICIYVVFVSFIFPGVTKLLLQDTIGYWGLIIGIAALIIAGIVGALITCFADAKQLKTMCLLQGVAILLYGIYKILPQVEPGFEWSQVPPAIEKIARSSFFMCFVILACILGFVAFLVIKTMPYVAGIVAMVNTQDSGETKEDEMPEDDDWVAEASDCLRHKNVSATPENGTDTEDPEKSENTYDQVIEMIRSLSQDINDYFRQLPLSTTYDEPLGDYQTETKASRNAVESAVASDEPLVQNASGTSAQQKLEESEKPVKLEKPKKAKKTQKAQDAKTTKKQAKKIAKLEREIAERDRQIFCTKWYARASGICFAITCVVILLAIFSLIQLILVDLDAARNAWDSVRAIIIYQQLSLAVQLILYVVCRAIGAPTNKWGLKALRKEQKRQKRDLKALQTR